MKNNSSFAVGSLLTVVVGLLVGIILPILMSMEVIGIFISVLALIAIPVLGFYLGRYVGRGILAFVWFASEFLGTTIADSLDARFNLPLVEAGNVGVTALGAIGLFAIAAVVFAVAASSTRVSAKLQNPPNGFK